ncbi:hypothetical protein CY0110_16157 [Crocosphaera chwakensis CCY0110]|uniref:Uncharacterized protein n=1 Tax=Crocosphaera chwakensis CCY0110 TaxID=391612 RepID=A3IHR3_9CHRO|nr:hypothetical protein CY0110_16157 [Crocosphaera chwakensis CCY0110]
MFPDTSANLFANFTLNSKVSCFIF